MLSSVILSTAKLAEFPLHHKEKVANECISANENFI
jgi:hypothetical protein